MGGGPIADRDSVYRFHTERLENGDIFFTLEDSTHPDYPEGNNGRVRYYQDIKAYIRKVPNFSNTWDLTQIAHVDINGNLPVWLINKFMMRNACKQEIVTFYENMKNLDALKLGESAFVAKKDASH
jgi:hypothetical protein